MNDPLRPAFRFLAQLHGAQVSCCSSAVVLIVTRLKKQAICQYSRAIRHNIDYNDRVVIFSIHGDDLARALKGDYTRKEILGLTHLMMREVRGGRRTSASNLSDFISARTSLIRLLHVLAYTNPDTVGKSSSCSLRQGCINRLLAFFNVRRCNKECTSHSQSLGSTVHNLIDSMDVFTNTTCEWKLVEEELKHLQKEIAKQNTLLHDIQVPERWVSMREKCRLQSSELRNMEDLYWYVF
ncbi:hypothetical protein C8J56DRAFT_915079 [Mycena floridula]|nr:hypothetical protein C8J56DRAFT_915079 [Mycena floridula]